MRTTGYSAYGDLEHFEPIISNECDCYARCKVRCAEIPQAIDIIKELVAKIPNDGIGGKPKAKVVPEGQSHVLIEQPRGEAFYYVRGNGTKYLDRFRLRTPRRRTSAVWCARCRASTLRRADDHPYHRPVHQLHGKVGGNGNFQAGEDDAPLAYAQAGDGALPV